MDNTTHLSQKIHQNAKNAPNKAHLNNRTKTECNSNENQTVAKLQKSIDRKAKKQKGSTERSECVLFCSGYK